MADASFFNNINDLFIEGGSFNFNAQNGTVTNCYNNSTVQHTQVVKRVEFVFSAGQSDTIIPQGTGSQTLCLLLAKAQQLIGVLPGAHLGLARYCAGWGRQRTTRNELRNNVVSVGVPLIASSLFSALPPAIRFMAFYILVSTVVLDILHPMRLERRASPDALVKVLDALGKYHDFPWAACENLTTFHAELVKRSRNQPGYPFIKSRWYELEYNGRIMQQEDWKAIKPFTLLSVDIFITQGEAPMVTCPWCKSENSLPSSYEESTDAMCSCTQCGRDFAVMNSLQAEHDNTVVVNLDLEILRLRVKIQPSKTGHQGRDNENIAQAKQALSESKHSESKPKVLKYYYENFKHKLAKRRLEVSRLPGPTQRNEKIMAAGLVHSGVQISPESRTSKITYNLISG